MNDVMIMEMSSEQTEIFWKEKLKLLVCVSTNYYYGCISNITVN